MVMILFKKNFGRNFFEKSFGHEFLRGKFLILNFSRKFLVMFFFRENTQFFFFWVIPRFFFRIPRFFRSTPFYFWRHLKRKRCFRFARILRKLIKFSFLSIFCRRYVKTFWLISDHISIQMLNCPNFFLSTTIFQNMNLFLFFLFCFLPSMLEVTETSGPTKTVGGGVISSY